MIELPVAARLLVIDPTKRYVLFVPFGTDIKALAKLNLEGVQPIPIIAVEDPDSLRVVECR